MKLQGYNQYRSGNQNPVEPEEKRASNVADSGTTLARGLADHYTGRRDPALPTIRAPEAGDGAQDRKDPGREYRDVRPQGTGQGPEGVHAVQGA